MSYRVCPDCGTNLDPGEICDCKNKNAASRRASPKDGEAKRKQQPIAADIIAHYREVIKAVVAAHPERRPI